MPLLRGGMEIMMKVKFNENLKKVRKSKGLTQKALAEKLGVALSTVAMWETGSRQPDYQMLNKIAEFFGVSFDDLLEDKSEKEPIGGDDIYVAYEDDEVFSIRELVRTRPEMKMLFSVSKNATREDIERTVAIIEALKGSSSN